jgi:hypothetical protein
MEYKTIKRNGWKITRDDDIFYLTYSPDILGESGACYRVNEEVYKRALDSNIELKQLIDEFNIMSNFKKIYNTSKPPKLSVRENSPDKFYGSDFIVIHEDDKYYLNYLLSRHGGGERRFEISKEIYDDARKGAMSTSDIFKKYNLYHLDVPENDVK